jgi:hypothetical protein
MAGSGPKWLSQLMLIATIFRRDRASFGVINTSRGSQRLLRRLYPTEGVMRSKDKEYRQRNHRPSYEDANPVQHRDTVMPIYTQISANDDRAMPNPFDLDDRL